MEILFLSFTRAMKVLANSSLGRVLGLLLMLSSPTTWATAECVVLLHGLVRSADSMAPIANALQANGFVVANVDYPSRDHEIPDLANLAVSAGIARCPDEIGSVHFVTHSLGGILVRYFLETNEIAKLGRVVMLGPPNQGSEVVDQYRDVPGFKFLNGPAGLQLGTDEASVPASLGPVKFPLGIIAGNTTLNPILSLSLPNPDDGKVSVESTKVEGMTDFIEVPHSHPIMMRADLVIQQTLHFLTHGEFQHDSQQDP